jgi:predicted RNA-binding Zn-ribbon protein involved in translation (DUF1610 family)
MAKKASELDAFSVKRGVCQGEGCGVSMAMPDKSNQDLCPNCLDRKKRDVAADQDKSFFDQTKASRRTAVVDFEDEDGSFGREGEKNTSAAWAHLLNHHEGLTLHEILYRIQQHGKGVDSSGVNRYSAPPADINSDHTDALQDIHEHDHEFGDLVPDHDHTPTDENPILRRGIDTTGSRRTAAYERNEYGQRIRGEEEECQDSSHIGNTKTPWGTFNPCPDCSIENQTEQEAEYDRRYPYRGGPDEYPNMTTASRKTATQFDTRADKLNPGQHIRTPTGGTTQVRRVRNHESSGKHVYVDTDLGTTVVPREDAFEVVPQNARQQESPGYGTPGGNSNTLPFDPHGPGGSNTSTSSSCPVCGTSGSLRRSGDHYTCSKCGYQENFGGPADKNYSSSTQVIRTFTNKNNNRRTASVIAQRARQVLDLEENQ